MIHINEPQNKVVEIDKLFIPANKFAYSKYAEKLALSYMCERMKISPTHIILTEGKVPTHDATIDDIQYEVKFSSKKLMHIEYANLENYPTGLFISTAKFYLTVSPGYSRNKKTREYELVGKVRLYERANLVQYALQCIEQQTGVGFYRPNEHGAGANYVILDSSCVKHQWIGDIKMEVINNRTSYYFDN